MILKKIINKTFLVILCILLIIIIVHPQNIIAERASPDDEREVPQMCSDGQHVQIFCMEGKIDCKPRDCP